MGELSRIGVALPKDLLDQFDALISRQGYGNRSEAFRDLMRDALVQEKVAQPKVDVIGTLTLVYDHHVRQLNDRLIGTQHDHYHQVVSTIHVHLDHDNCLEVLILRGQRSEIQKVADKLIATRGVRHGKLTLTTAKPV